jgi:lambda family phage portal protein
MKRNFIDRVVGFFSPSSEYNRTLAKAKIARAYEAANLYNSSDWKTATRGSANSEIRGALGLTRDRSRDLTRNNPYANKAVNVIVSNTVGAGIVPKIKGRTKSQEKALAREWKMWAESRQCDADGNFDFFGLQAAALRCIVESGEVLARKTIKNGTVALQLLEPDYIDSSYNNASDMIQGIWVDDSGRPVGYQLFQNHPGDYKTVNVKSVRIPATDIIHPRRIERIGQLRGMPWAAPIANALKDFADYQYATLVRQKISACYTAFITDDANPALSADALRDQRQLENNMEPGAVRYLSQGQDIKFASPPGVDQYDPFVKQTLRAIAAGYGISYESLTGDYSNVNFSSGRMGHLEMQRNIEMWRWQMLIPQFCQPAFEYFIKGCEMKGIPCDGVTVQWTAPAREMINPAQEISSLKDEVRNGFKTLPEAIRERGLDPDIVLEETAEFNQKMDDLGITFDSDARRVTAQGMTQPIPAADTSSSGDTTSGDQNEADASNVSS